MEGESEHPLLIGATRLTPFTRDHERVRFCSCRKMLWFSFVALRVRSWVQFCCQRFSHRMSKSWMDRILVWWLFGIVMPLICLDFKSAARPNLAPCTLDRYIRIPNPWSEIDGEISNLRCVFILIWFFVFYCRGRAMTISLVRFSENSIIYRRPTFGLWTPFRKLRLQVSICCRLPEALMQYVQAHRCHRVLIGL